MMEWWEGMSWFCYSESQISALPLPVLRYQNSPIASWHSNRGAFMDTEGGKSEGPLAPLYVE